MAVSWHCPRCNTNWHSAWARRSERTVKCECGADIDNPYFDPRGDWPKVGCMFDE